MKIWEDVLNVRPIGIHDNFFELGGHSLLAVTLFDRVAKATGQNLPLATLFECPTIERLAGALRERHLSPAWSSLVPVQPGGSKPPLFLVPPAAGSVLRFAELAKHLGQDQPVYGLEPLGHDDRHRPLDRVEDMASWYLEEIRQLQPTGPYLLAGICFGGLVAWEMALQLRLQGEHVALVALLDSGVPEHGPTWSPPTRSLGYYRRRIAHYARRVAHHCVAGTLVRIVCEVALGRLRRFGHRWHSHGRRLLRMFDAHRQAHLSYTGRRYAGRVLLIQSEESAHIQLFRERWAELATGEFECVVVPGTTHRDLLLGTDFTPMLARILREHLDRALTEPTSAEPSSVPFLTPSDDTARVRARRVA